MRSGPSSWLPAQHVRQRRLLRSVRRRENDGRKDEGEDRTLTCMQAKASEGLAATGSKSESE